jgi:hypothetical protein
VEVTGSASVPAPVAATLTTIASRVRTGRAGGRPDSDCGESIRPRRKRKGEGDASGGSSERERVRVRVARYKPHVPVVAGPPTARDHPGHATHAGRSDAGSAARTPRDRLFRWRVAHVGVARGRAAARRGVRVVAGVAWGS